MSFYVQNKYSNALNKSVHRGNLNIEAAASLHDVIRTIRVLMLIDDVTPQENCDEQVGKEV